MPASKDRLRWDGLPAPVHAVIEELAGGRVVAATNCAGGYSPGLASRLDLTAILAAHAGFCLKGAGPGPVGEYKRGLGVAALDWLYARRQE